MISEFFVELLEDFQGFDRVVDKAAPRIDGEYDVINFSAFGLVESFSESIRVGFNSDHADHGDDHKRSPVCSTYSHLCRLFPNRFA